LDKKAQVKIDILGSDGRKMGHLYYTGYINANWIELAQNKD
jgi:hypothetical protein